MTPLYIETRKASALRKERRDCAVTDEEIESAIAGSMFGWHVPAARAAVDAVKARL